MKKWMKVTGISVVSASLLLAGCQAEENAKADSKNAILEEKVVPGKQIALEGAINVRDLGGYKTEDGKTIKPHRLIRSAELYTITGNDIAKLKKTYQLKQIVDFRTDSEVDKKPDPPIQNVKNTHDSVMKDNGASTSTEDLIKSLSKMDNPESFLIEANKSFVTDENSRKAYKKFFDILLENKEGAVLWHCTAGKDRAGFGTALVLSALGVPKDKVMEDYLLSNKYRADENEKAVQAVLAETKNQQAADGMKAVMEVRESYLNAAFDEIDKKYGSLDAFLKEGLGLTKSDINKLKSMYLV